MIAWWAELFEIPCVAFDVAGPGDARDIVATGADFVACRLAPGLAVGDALETVAAFSNAVSDVHVEARP